MRVNEPSRTAWSAAVYRAAHQLVDPFQLYDDPLAFPILGITETEVRRGQQAQLSGRRMRFFIAARTKFADDLALAALARGTRQVVVLGAGLDTLAYRLQNLTATVFEVDHPSTQGWKRDLLAAADIAEQSHVVYVPVDFESDSLHGSLVHNGFRAEEPAFFVWLGVTPYLSLEAAAATLAYAGRTPGNEIVFDYANPVGALDEARRVQREKVMARVAKVGEPWVLFFDTDDLAVLLGSCGFDEIEDLGPGAIVDRFLGIPEREGDRNGAHLVRARRA